MDPGAHSLARRRGFLVEPPDGTRLDNGEDFVDREWIAEADAWIVGDRDALARLRDECAEEMAIERRTIAAARERVAEAEQAMQLKLAARLAKPKPTPAAPTLAVIKGDKP